MKRANKLRNNLVVIFLSILFIIAVILSWSYYPSLRLWKSIDLLLFNNFLQVSLFRIIHLSIGVPIFIYGMINVIEIISINQKAQLRKNVPKYLLKEGYYSIVRHPMYTMIISIQFSLFFSLCSSLGLLFSLFFVFLLMSFGLYEEKYQLLPLFGEEYKRYSNKVKTRFFPLSSKILIVLLYFISFLGVFL